MAGCVRGACLPAGRSLRRWGWRCSAVRISHQSGDAFTVAPTLVVDANTAPARVLTALPHVGPHSCGAWVAARADRLFSSPEDAQSRVRGLGPATLAQIAPYLRFEPSTQSDVHYDRQSKGAKDVALEISEQDTSIVASSAGCEVLGTRNPADRFRLRGMTADRIDCRGRTHG